MRRRVRWHDRKNGSSSGSALRLVRTSSARLRRNRWNGSSNESGTSREGPRASASRRQWRSWPKYMRGLARLFRLLRNARSADRSPSLGPVATSGRSLAPVENTTASPRGAASHCGFSGSHAQYGRQRPWPLASRPEQSPSLELSNAYFRSLRLPSLFGAFSPSRTAAVRTRMPGGWEGWSREAPPYPDLLADFVAKSATSSLRVKKRNNRIWRNGF